MALRSSFLWRLLKKRRVVFLTKEPLQQNKLHLYSFELSIFGERAFTFRL